MFKRKLYYSLTPNLRLLLRRLYFFPIDLYEHLIGKNEDLAPPRGLVFVGDGDFKRTGEILLEQIQRVYKIKPNDVILDVGCGIGRLAVPLTKIINENGRYEGFDIVKRGIDWCTAHINVKYQNFNFKHIDLKNDLYNLNTKLEAKDFIFPYPDNFFDLVILTSVFTHMMPNDVDNYLGQIYRVMKKDGKCFATFFLLNNEIRTAIEKRDYFNFPFKYNNFSLIDKNVKEANIAYEEDYLLKNLLPKNKLRIDNIYYGWWSDKPKEKCLSFQDTIILSKS